MSKTHSMRGIKYKDSVYTINNGSLCDRCGANDCPIHDDTNKCNSFIPILPFKEPIVGMETMFNTFRLGGAWMNRVDVGSVVALYNTRTKELFGRATVEGISVNITEEQSLLHGQYNHNLLEQDIPQYEIVELINKRLKKAYGNMIFNNSSKTTVIYLKRII